MKNESVAILDIRSNEVSFSLGSKGVNATFVFNGSHNEPYEGYSVENGFYDEDSFRRAVNIAITSVRQNYEGVIREVYVGVPSCFITLHTKGHTNSYQSKRKISAQDVDALYESGLNDLLASGMCIRRSEMYFTLGDNRKYFSASDLYGVSTNMLKGALCYYFVQERFYNIVEELLTGLGFSEIHFIPSTLAQSKFLIPQNKREGYAFLLDVGFLTTSISVIYGNGIVHEATFDCGVGQILALLVQQLDVSYSMAEEILLSANISGGNVPEDLRWTNERSEVSFSVRAINDIIKWGLDVLCEEVQNFFDTYYREKNYIGLTVNPIELTGEGMGWIKGAPEHISKRLNRLTEVVYPDLPYYDKPMHASRISLLDMAISDKQKKSWFQKIFNGLGGKRK